MKKIFATDLDGTLIPLAKCDANILDLKTLKQELESQRIPVVFATGRSKKLTLEAIREFSLPKPNWIICDVGTSIFALDSDGQYSPVQEYQGRLAKLSGNFNNQNLQAEFSDVSDLKLQPVENQSVNKLSYFVEPDKIAAITEQLKERIGIRQIPRSVINSIDEETGVGLLDLLPRGVNKHFALSFWCDHFQIASDNIVFAGDSGNDLAVFDSGIHSIVVSNASPTVIQTLKKNSVDQSKIYFSDKPASSGVLEGLRHFDVI